MINKKRKGFTIVELVIVIVIVGVLAAVLIPTFGSLIKKANESADMQTVYQMNIILAAESVENGELDDIGTILDILAENGFTGDNLKPSSEDHKFMWDDENKVVILVKPNGNGGFKQIYPVVDGDGTVGSGVVDLKVPDGKPYIPGQTDLSEGGTYYLEAPLTITSTNALEIELGIDLTLNLNGQTLTIGSSQQSGFADLSNSANVNVGDEVVNTASEEETEGPLINVLGTLTINGGTIISTAGCYVDNTKYIYSSCGLVVGEGGTLNLDGTNLTLSGKGEYGIFNDGGTVNITNGNFKIAADKTAEIGINCLIVNYNGITTITGSSIMDSGPGTVSYRYEAPIAVVFGEIKMYSVSISSSYYCTYMHPYGLYGDPICKITIDGDSELTLTGEKYVAPCGEYYAYNVYNDDPTNNIEYYGEELVFLYSGDGDTDGIYFDIKKACADGKPIELEEDFKLENSIVVNETPTIDLNGKILTIDKEGLFTGDGTLNITGNGTLIMGASIENCFSGKLSVCGDEGAKINVKVNDSAISELFAALNEGYEFKNCTLEHSDSDGTETLSVNNKGVISLESNIGIIEDLCISEGKSLTINLNGKELDTNNNNNNKTITVSDGCTLNIVGGAITESTFPFETEGTGKVIIDGTKIPINYLDEVVNSTAITAKNVTAGNFTVNEAEGKTTLTLIAAETLNADTDITVSSGNTLVINLNGKTLTNNNKITVKTGENGEGGGVLTVNGRTDGGTVNGTVDGSGSFIVKDGGSLSISNSTINNSIAVTGSTLTISGSTVSKAITADSASKVTFTTVNVTMPQADFFNLLTVVMASNNSTMTNVSFEETSNKYFTVTKAVGKATTIKINYDESLTEFTLKTTLTIPAGCDVTLDNTDREIQIGGDLASASIVVNGTLTINQGNIRTISSSEFTVTATGKLVLNAKNYYGTFNSLDKFLGRVTVASGGQVVDAEGTVLKS